MIYLSNLTKITDKKYAIGCIHYMPFDEKHGLGKTKEELEKTGILLDNIPQAQQLEGKYATMYWNPIKKEIFYEYEDIPKTQEEVQAQTVKTLVEQVAQEKLKNIQKDKAITELTKELASVKLDVINLKGSVK